MRLLSQDYPSRNLTLYFEQEDFIDFGKRLLSRVRHNIRPYFSISNGPREVRKSIQLGFTEMDKQASLFPQDTHWILSGRPSGEIIRKIHKESLILVGPNVEFHEIEILDQLNHMDNVFYIAPSKWVVPILAQRLSIKESKVLIWPNGIDTQRWSSEKPKLRKALVYLKGAKDQRFDDVMRFLTRAQYPVIEMHYGNYSPNQFHFALSQSEFAIWIGGTESQGIAMIEAWSMDVPTFVFKSDLYSDPVTNKTFEASSAPYLSEFTGRFSSTESLIENELESFITDLDLFSPRDYVLDHFNALTSTSKMINQIFRLKP